MENISIQLYNLNEWLLLRLFRVVTGLKLAFNPNLEKIHLITLDEIKSYTLQIIEAQISDEFGIQLKPRTEQIDYQKAIRGSFLNTSRIAIKLNKTLPREKESAVMVVTNHWLAPTNLLLSRIIHTFQPILGITYLVYGICFITTLNNKLSDELLRFAAIHEVGHLLGKHGYPLQWLRRKRKSAK